MGHKRRGVYKPLILALIALAAALVFHYQTWFIQAWNDLRGAEAVPQGATQAVTLYDEKAGTLTTLPLEDYLLGVVSAEMPAAFDLEALKAQAVAARTRAVKSLRALGGSGCSLHPGADICASPNHCQAWEGQGEQRQRWGSDFAAYRAKIAKAVADTAGEIMTYEGEPILVLYHANSGGKTEDVEHVFAQAVPYLRGVDSPGEEEASSYANTARFTLGEAAKALNAALPQAHLAADKLSSQLQVLTRYDSGRVATMRVGQATCDGRAFRTVLGLKSANFALSFEADALVVQQIGYGHGVGMSQVGADAMAREGQDYRAILTHFYQGIMLSTL